VIVMTVNQAHGATARAEHGTTWHWPVPPDPGDLSRRLTARRTELRLSLNQVASRAGVELRYLAYLDAFTTASGLMVLPVNYAITGGGIVIRTGVGSLIAGHGDGPVTFEADHFDLELGQGWSVVVLGDAHRVLQPGELRHLHEECDLQPWPSGEHDLFVRIVPTQITGRRVRSQ
jgi:hypothetical protein